MKFNHSGELNRADGLCEDGVVSSPCTSEGVRGRIHTIPPQRVDPSALLNSIGLLNSMLTCTSEWVRGIMQTNPLLPAKIGG